MEGRDRANLERAAIGLALGVDIDGHPRNLPDTQALEELRLFASKVAALAPLVRRTGVAECLDGIQRSWVSPTTQQRDDGVRVTRSCMEVLNRSLTA
jgi:hypothetical protein